MFKWGGCFERTSHNLNHLLIKIARSSEVAERLPWENAPDTVHKLVSSKHDFPNSLLRLKC